MPQEITKPTPLLKEDGSTVVGWASSNLLDYNKIDCAAPLARIKEWDPIALPSGLAGGRHSSARTECGRDG